MTTRREFLLQGAAAAGAAVFPKLSRAGESRRPNLVFVLADDLGYGDLGCYGRTDYTTPNIDGLAKAGLRFTSCSAAAPVCSPTRLALITGRYPARLPLGLKEPLDFGDESVGLPPDHPTIASRLKLVGYDTALLGKWHLGYRPEWGPLRHGFDEFFGILSGGVDYFAHQDPNGKPDLFEGTTPVEKSGYLTDLLTERAVEYIRRKRTAPFYLALHYTAPHWPWEGPSDTAASAAYMIPPDGGQRRFKEGGSPEVYARMVQRLDEGVGKVLAALRDSGIERETLVVFTSDNGGERYSNNAPFSGRKFTLNEGGIRVPAIVRWPGTVAAGRTTDAPAITMDWTATLLAAAGGIADPAFPLDGVDLSPLWRDKKLDSDRTFYWRTRAQAAARRGRWKYLRAAGEDALYDLSSDPRELSNLASKDAATLSSLKTAYDRWNREMLPLPS